MGMLFVPIVMLLFVVFFAISMFGSLFGGGGHDSVYDEDVMQDYAYAQYVAEFGDAAASAAYEDNLLIVFLTDETSDGYYTIAFVGDNLRDEVSDLFGNEYTAYGRAMLSAVADHHEYSLSSDLASVMTTMTRHVTELNLASNFIVETDHSGAVDSHLTNHSSLTMNAATVERALTEFTAQTDIPVVIVVEDVADVFGKQEKQVDLVALLVLGVFAVVAIVLIVRALRKRDRGTSEDDTKYTPGNGTSDQNQTW